MPLSSNAYGSVLEVAAYVQHAANGAGTFDTTTSPTIVQVEQFIERRSALLNACLAEAGYTVPVTVAQAKLILDHYAVMGAAGDVELSLRNSGTSDEENPRAPQFLNEFNTACNFLKSAAFAALLVPQGTASPAIAGLYVGGRTRTNQALRPIFTRGMFGNNPTRESGTREPGYTEEP
jgi:hypothetical protein